MGSAEEAAKDAASKPADDELPPYSEAGEQPGPSSAISPSTTAGHAYPQPPPLPPGASSAAAAGPTVDSPFNFPAVDEDLPLYAPTSTSSSTLFAAQRPIAIPQTRPLHNAPFLHAYPPILLRYGITQATWDNFLETLSAFLTANVSDRALAHAGEMGKKLSAPATELWKDTVADVKQHGKSLNKYAKNGDYIDVTFGVIEGAISIPLNAAIGTIGAVFDTPFAALGAVLKKPQKARARAAAYLQVVNKDWLWDRGLEARVVDTSELSEQIGTSVPGLVSMAKGEKRGSVEGLLRAMEDYVEKLEVKEDAKLDIGSDNLWLLLARREMEIEASQPQGKGKGKATNEE